MTLRTAVRVGLACSLPLLRSSRLTLKLRSRTPGERRFGRARRLDGTVRLNPPLGLVAQKSPSRSGPSWAFGLRASSELCCSSRTTARPVCTGWLAVCPCSQLGYGDHPSSERARHARDGCSMRSHRSERWADLRASTRATTGAAMVHPSVWGATRRQLRSAGCGRLTWTSARPLLLSYTNSS